MVLLMRISNVLVLQLHERIVHEHLVHFARDQRQPPSTLKCCLPDSLTGNEYLFAPNLIMLAVLFLYCILSSLPDWNEAVCKTCAANRRVTFIPCNMSPSDRDLMTRCLGPSSCAMINLHRDTAPEVTTVYHRDHSEYYVSGLSILIALTIY
jgi:hypothetical protein